MQTPTTMLDGFAARVRRARQAAGFKTQAELAEALGVHFSAVSNWERAISFATAPDLYCIAKKLGVTTDWLIAGDTSGLTDAKRRMLDGG